MTIMTNRLDARILENNQSWYWELIDGHEVLARGVADTREEAWAQAADAERKAMNERSRPQTTPLISEPMGGIRA